MNHRLLKRARILKRFESSCYSVCLYLLQDKEQALLASEAVLTRIIMDDKLDRITGRSDKTYVHHETIQIVVSKSPPSFTIEQAVLPVVQSVVGGGFPY